MDAPGAADSVATFTELAAPLVRGRVQVLWRRQVRSVHGSGHRDRQQPPANPFGTRFDRSSLASRTDAFPAYDQLIERLISAVTKGLFITTSYTRDPGDYAASGADQVVIVDGARLTALVTERGSRRDAETRFMSLPWTAGASMTEERESRRLS